jgi:glucose-6-phosphate 1-epimerase
MDRLPDGARVDRGAGGLERLRLSADAGEAEVFLHGAHVTRYAPRGGRLVLFVSRESRYEAGKPIRGGVPVCFPWFGPKAGTPEAPLHGFARTRPWTLASVAPAPGGRLRALFELASDQTTRDLHPYELRLSLDVLVGASLVLSLTVHNTDERPFAFEEALHTYLAVSDVRRCRVTGLEGTSFVDKTAGGVRRPGEPSPIVVRGETDRVYLGTDSTVTVEDPVGARRITIAKTGSRTTVVWNPWVAKAQAMPDFGDDEWPGMICIETANAMEDAVTLAPGASHTLTATIEATPL